MSNWTEIQRSGISYLKKIDANIKNTLGGHGWKRQIVTEIFYFITFAKEI